MSRKCSFLQGLIEHPTSPFDRRNVTVQMRSTITVSKDGPETFTYRQKNTDVSGPFTLGHVSSSQG